MAVEKLLAEVGFIVLTLRCFRSPVKSINLDIDSCKALQLNQTEELG
jgi:hypothetical protein